MSLGMMSHEPYLQVAEDESYLETMQFRGEIDASFLATHRINGLHYGCGTHMIGGMLNLDAQTFGMTEFSPLSGINKMAGEVPLAVTDETGKTSLVKFKVPADKPALFFTHNAAAPLPIEDGVFDYVLSQHFIEHISPDLALSWLTEVKRTMKKGGVLRVSTPDLRLYVEGYLDPEQKFFSEHRRILKNFGYEQVDTKAQMLNQIFLWWKHRFIYDFADLKNLLENAGFNGDQIYQRAFRTGKVLALASMDLSERIDESLYVEAIA